MFIFALAVIIGYAIYAMSPEERLRALSAGANTPSRRKTKRLAEAPSRIRFVTLSGNGQPVRSRPWSSRVSASPCSC